MRNTPVIRSLSNPSFAIELLQGATSIGFSGPALREPEGLLYPFDRALQLRAARVALVRATLAVEVAMRCKHEGVVWFYHSAQAIRLATCSRVAIYWLRVPPVQWGVLWKHPRKLVVLFYFDWMILKQTEL